jgi:hypothetical protein
MRSTMTSTFLCPRQDSNLRTTLRRRVLYPLSYGGPSQENSIARRWTCRQER